MVERSNVIKYTRKNGKSKKIYLSKFILSSCPFLKTRDDTKGRIE
jgi:hypothetical protein